MSKKSMPRLPKSVLDKASNTKSHKKDHSQAISTADDYLELGIDEEESGDRWYASDIAKSLRAYQRAYEAYNKSVGLDSTVLDAYYNVSRLVFHVYNNFTKLDQIKLNKLINVDNCFGNDGVVRNLEEIVKMFEIVLNKFEQASQTSWDLIYNAALLYQEVIDSNDDEHLAINEVVQVGQMSMNLYTRYINHQVSELQDIVAMQTASNNDDLHDMQPVAREEEPEADKPRYQEFEVITPVNILQTLLSAYGLIRSIYENAASQQQQQGEGDTMMMVNVSVSQFYEVLESNLQILTNTQFPGFDEESQETVLGEIDRAKYLLRIFNSSSIQDAIQSLKNLPATNEDFEFYLSANDLISNLISSSQQLERDTVWDFYSLASSFLKKSQTIIQDQLPTTSGDKVSAKYGLISSILINRADIDFERSKIAPDVKTADILKNNSSTLLKNAIHWSGKTGGLRENVTDKLNRTYMSYRAQLRLNFANGDGIENVVADRTNWIQEVQEISEVYKV